MTLDCKGIFIFSAGVCDIHLALPRVYHIPQPTHNASNTPIDTTAKYRSFKDTLNLLPPLPGHCAIGLPLTLSIRTCKYYRTIVNLLWQYFLNVNRGLTEFHIGLNDLGSEGNWQWSDGSKVNHFNWHDTEPNQFPGDGDTVRMHYDQGQWKWRDGPSKNTIPFLCSNELSLQGITLLIKTLHFSQMKLYDKCTLSSNSICFRIAQITSNFTTHFKM